MHINALNRLSSQRIHKDIQSGQGVEGVEGVFAEGQLGFRGLLFNLENDVAMRQQQNAHGLTNKTNKTKRTGRKHNETPCSHRLKDK